MNVPAPAVPDPNRRHVSPKSKAVRHDDAATDARTRTNKGADGKRDPLMLAAFAYVLRHALATKATRREPREQRPPFAAFSYLAMAESNRAFSRLSDVAWWLLQLLAVRADDSGRVTFRRRELLTLYGLAPGDINDGAFLRALDALRRGGWLTIVPCRGGANTYTLALPRGAEPRERLEG